MTKLKHYLTRFNEQNILVLGDMIADEFIYGQPERISREAPVLILEQHDHEILPGGGTNAANNVAALGGQVYLAGIIGDDRVGRGLTEQLKQEDIKTEGLIIDESRPTAVKTRILAGGEETVKQQVVRVDKLETHLIAKRIETRLLAYVEEIIDQIDAILLSDYGNGVFTDSLKDKIIKLGQEKDKIITVDSRYSLKSFKGVTIATPNREEAEEAVGFELDKPQEIEQAGEQLRSELDSEAMLITLGGEGMQMFTAEGSTHIPASNYAEVYDVTGAGDTVIGTLTLALASGASMVEAMKLSNHAAGIVVRKLGVATTNQQEMIAAMGKEGQDEE
ncbi:MAG: bifunctional heptose 7-phosphate kinase/heptose 1-phosphate adenyltransferase [Bacillota bacterium]